MRCRVSCLDLLRNIHEESPEIFVNDMAGAQVTLFPMVEVKKRALMRHNLDLVRQYDQTSL